MQRLRALLIGYFVIFASVLTFVTPVYEAPDEVAHVDYMNFLSEHGELPSQYVPEKAVPWEGHQPPLYYLPGALLIHIFKADHRLNVTLEGNKLHTSLGGPYRAVPIMNHLKSRPFDSSADRLLFYSLRLFSVFLGAVTLVYIGKLATLVFGSDLWGIFPVLFAATLPQYAFISAVINNDNLADVLGAMSIYHLCRLADRPARLGTYVAVGVSLGLGLLTKKTMLCLVPGAVFVPVYLLIERREQRGRILAYTALAAVLVLAISGWLFVRNQQLYGDLLGTRMERETMPGIVNEKPLFSEVFFGKLASDLAASVRALLGLGNAGLHSYQASLLGNFVFKGLLTIAGSALFIAIAYRLMRDFGRAFALWAAALCLGMSVLHATSYEDVFFGIFVITLFATFVASFGYLIIGLAHQVYVMYGFLFLFSGIGVAWRLILERFRNVKALASLIVAFGFFAGAVHYTMSYANVQGRWLFPALGPIAILVAFGLRQVVARFGRATEIVMILAAAGGFVVADVLTIRVIHYVYYERPDLYF